MKRRFFYIFWNLHENAFCFIFFLNKRNITTYPLMIYLKYTAVHYTNLNSSSVNNPFLKYRPLNMLVCFFFRFLIYVYFNKTFFKNFMKKIYFLIQIHKSYFKIFFFYSSLNVDSYAILFDNIDRQYINKMVLKWYLNGRTLNMKQNLKNRHLLFR